MKISMLNGSAPMNGFSSVIPGKSYVKVNRNQQVNVNGFSRVLAYPTIQGLTLNGNGGGMSELELLSMMPDHIQAEFMAAFNAGVPSATMQGLKSWLKERKAKKAEKKEAKAEKKESKQELKMLRIEKRKQRLEDGTDLGSTLRNVAGDVASAAGNVAKGIVANLGSKLGAPESQYETEVIEDAIYEDYEDAPSNNQKKKKGGLQEWWEDLSTGAKVGVGIGAVVAIDAFTGGNIILKRVGIMKKGKK